MNRWNLPGVPHKGWLCEDVIDLRGDDSADDTDYAECEMCGQERIRYVHRMKHADGQSLSVGCVCAEKMTDDYVGPREREGYLRKRTARRGKWLTRKWRTSWPAGNLFLNIGGQNIGVHATKFGKWGYRIEGKFGRQHYDTQSEAKLALFDALFPRHPSPLA